MVRLRPSHKKNHGYIDHLKSGDSDSIMDKFQLLRLNKNESMKDNIH